MIPRDGVACASVLNWCSFILMLFATISSYWTWGYAFPPANSGSLASVTISLGPWVAAQAWSNIAVPCSCSGGVCWQWCVVGTAPVMWNNIPAAAACDPNSTVFRTWSGPLGYCSFPPDANITIPADMIPDNATGVDSHGVVPAGTSFNGPSQVIAIQALTIIATITVFFAAVAGCADAGSETGMKALGGTAALCSLIAWVFTLAAYCTWAAIPYVQKIQTLPPQVYVPIWIDQSSNYMSATEVADTWLGPGWATALTASILIFFANIIHCMSLKGEPDTSYDEPKFAQEPIPAGNAVPAASVPSVAVPAAAVPPAVTVATV